KEVASTGRLVRPCERRTTAASRSPRASHGAPAPKRRGPPPPLDPPGASGTGPAVPTPRGSRSESAAARRPATAAHTPNTAPEKLRASCTPAGEPTAVAAIVTSP